MLAALHQERTDQGTRVLDHVGERDALVADGELPGLDAHALQQIIDELCQAQRAALQRVHQLALLRSGYLLLHAGDQQLDGGELRGERRAELVRDVGEHRVTCTAHRLELGLVADHLHLQAIDLRGAGDDGGARAAGGALQMLERGGAAGVARLDDRTAEVARPPPVLVARLEHIAAEAPDRLLGGHIQQPRGLRVEVADETVAVDRVDALDDAAEYRLRLGLAPPQRAGEIDEVAAHVLHGARQRADFGGTARRDGGREITAAETRGGAGELAHRADHRLAEVSRALAGSSAWISAIASPLEANTGTAAA